MVIVASLSARCYAAGGGAVSAVAGTVRDVHGTPQMGALVELMAADATIMATAFSDAHGRYIMPSVAPGQYQMRATAAFFMPVLRSNLRLRAGAESVVNLTLSSMFEADNWLPAQRRRADEPVDDWKWTLRSTASRPLLRLIDPEDGIAVSSSAEQGRRAASQGRVMVTNGDGAFGDGGMHQALLLSRTTEDGGGTAMRADVGDTQNSYAVGPSVAVTAGYERRSPLGGSTRLVSSFQSHPELTNGAANGFQVLHLASTQQLALGDAVLIDFGTLLQAERLVATRFEAEPFVRATVRLGDEVIVEYRFATGRELQSSDDLDRLKPTLTALTDANGRPLKTKGSHQEIGVSRKLGTRVVSFSAYADQFSHGSIAGSGLIDRASLQQVAVVADPSTGTFQLATTGYSGRGVRASLMQPLTPALSAWAEYDLGTALWSAGGVSALTNPVSNVAPHTAQAASVALRGRILHSGTAVKAEYRWQPLRTLTQVNAYNTTPEETYLSFYVRQRVCRGRFLPQGMDAVVEASNLLEQGYQPVLAPDGQTLFLAQVPRAVQGGLAFNF